MEGYRCFCLLLAGMALSIRSEAYVMITTDVTSKIIPLIRRPAFVSKRALSELKTDHSDRITGTNDQDLLQEKNNRQRREKVANVGHIAVDVRSQRNGTENGDQNSNLVSGPREKYRGILVNDGNEIFFRWRPGNPGHQFPPSSFVNQKLALYMNDGLVGSKLPWKEFKSSQLPSANRRKSKFSSRISNKLKNRPEKSSNKTDEGPKFLLRQGEAAKFTAGQVNQSKWRPLPALLPLEKRASAPTLWSNLKHPFGKHASPKSVHLAKRSVHSTLSRRANDAIVSLVDGDAARCGVAWTVSSERLIPIYEAETVDFFPKRHENEQRKHKLELSSVNRLKMKRERNMKKVDRREHFPSQSIEKSKARKLITPLFEEREPEPTISSNYFLHTSIPAFPESTKATGLLNNSVQTGRIVTGAKASRFPSLHSAPAQKLAKSHFSQVQKEQASSKTGVRNGSDFAQQVPQLFPGIRGSEMEVGPLRRNRTTPPILVSGILSEEDLKTKDASKKFEENEVKPFIDEHQRVAEVGSEQVNTLPENLNRTSSSSLTFEENIVTSEAERHQDNRRQSFLKTLERDTSDTKDLHGQRLSHMSRKMEADRSITHGPLEKILGGRKVMRGAFPWMVALVDKMKLTVVCGGTIVSQGWVLTAAHCALKQHKLLVSVGEHNVRRRTGREMYYEVKEAYIHESFDPRTYDSDIALLHLSDSPVKISMGGRKPPRDVANVGGIPVFLDPKTPEKGKKDKMKLFNSAFHIWSHLLKCMPKNGSMSEDHKQAYLRYLSLIFQQILENEEGESSNPEMCLPSLFVNVFAVVATGKPLPMLDHCQSNTKALMSKQKRFLEFLEDSLRITPLPGVNIDFDVSSDSEQDDNGVPNLLTSLISNVAQNIIGSENLVSDAIDINIGDVPFLSTLLHQISRRKPSTSDDSVSSTSQQEPKNCPPLPPREEIESIIQPRNSNGFKALNLQADFVKAGFANPSIKKASSTHASNQNHPNLPSHTRPVFPHYSACLPNPQFFKSAKLDSMSDSSSKVLHKINEYQKTQVRSTVNPSSLKKAPSNKVANPSKPVYLGRASRFLIRSIDSIHDSQEQRTDHFFADEVHNKATRDAEGDPGAHPVVDAGVGRRGTRSENDEGNLERIKAKKHSEDARRQIKNLEGALQFHGGNESVKAKVRKEKNFFGIGKNFTKADQRERESVKTHKKEATAKRRRFRGRVFARRKLRCVVLGWGQTASTGGGSDVLRHAKVPILSPRKCEEVHSDLTVTENMLCAGDLDASKDTCKGDSGGPLLCEDRKNGEKVQWAVVGVTSFGVGCGQLGVYTNVQRYTAWIKEVISKSLK